MPGDPKRPVDGEIIVSCDGLQGGGRLAGLSIAGVRAFVAKNLPEFVIPPEKIARVTTMDADDEAWKQVASEERVGLMMMKTDTGMLMYQGASKVVPETYVLREADVNLAFEDPPSAAPATPV